MTERQEQKPDAVVRVNDFDVTLYRRGRGLYIRVQKDETDIGFFGIAGGSPAASLPQQSEEAPAPASVERRTAQASVDATLPEEIRTGFEGEKRTITGVFDIIEPLGTTPVSGDPIVRFTVKEVDAGKTWIYQSAVMRQMAKVLDGLTRSEDPNIILQPGRQISAEFIYRGSSKTWYPPVLEYAPTPHIPPIRIFNPKVPKKG